MSLSSLLIRPVIRGQDSPGRTVLFYPFFLPSFSLQIYHSFSGSSSYRAGGQKEGKGNDLGNSCVTDPKSLLCKFPLSYLLWILQIQLIADVMYNFSRSCLASVQPIFSENFFRKRQHFLLLAPANSSIQSYPCLRESTAPVELPHPFSPPKSKTSSSILHCITVPLPLWQACIIKSLSFRIIQIKEYATFLEFLYMLGTLQWNEYPEMKTSRQRLSHSITFQNPLPQLASMGGRGSFAEGRREGTGRVIS